MTDTPVRIGLQIQPEHAEYRQIRRAAAEAEELGVDIVFNWDHFFPLDGDPDGRHFEAWTMLGAWAESTSRVEIGTLVSSTGYRNPDLLADMARTVDHISEGRLVLGIGAGWFERDYLEYGYEFATAGQRLDALAGDLPRIRSRWSRLNPPPTRPIPVLIGGGGERKTLRLVAEHADIWHCFGDVETLAHKITVLRRHCADIGRDIDDIEISTAVAGGPTPPGTPDVLGERMRALGVSLFTVGAHGPDYDLGVLKDWVAWRDDLATGTA
ncbi:LLM class F420-dependent oxidoreductase [Planosporangium sp. 12N6]|uniref:LLM class F420-dependent oxidoreductase n=1 Tax=Planosporangium spinosum TaxID=3402278 RepID=UPI003CF0BCA4